MASKKAGRLAGLATLAGLAYMATRDKDKDAKGAVKSDAKVVPPDRDDSERVIGSRAPAPAKEVPFKGMPVDKNDVLPEYLGKQGSRPASVGGKPEIMDEYDDQSPAYKKNEFGEVYQAMREKDRKAYQDRKDRINANVDNPGYSAGMKKGGKVKKMASGGMASKRGDGIASKGKTRCKMY